MREAQVEAHPSGRDAIVDALRRELVGPSPAGHLLELTDGAARFASKEDSYGPWTDSVSGEEILERDPPTRRYGVAVLYPPREAPEPGDDLAASGGQATSAEVTTEDEGVPPQEDVKVNPARVADASDFDISLANSFKPSAMGLSFLVTLEHGSALKVDVSGAAYLPVPVLIGGQTQHNPWWVRRPNTASCLLPAEDLLAQDATLQQYDLVDAWPGLRLELNVFSRPWKVPHQRLVTISLVNRSTRGERLDAKCLFQSHMHIAAAGKATIVPYPEREQAEADPEIASFNLLYRNALTYAVGHGCAADWDPEEGGGVSLRAEALPVYQTPSITPDITLEDGREITVPLAPLAGEVEGDDGLATLSEVVSAYEAWISRRRGEASLLPHQALRDTAEEHLDHCKVALERMKRGLQLLESDETVLRAFRMMNAAMLEQQLRSARSTRPTSLVDGRFVVEGSTDPTTSRTSRSWRAFQIGFMLTALPGIVERNGDDRETVELIFFPTGGGKTEAYLGIAAVSMLLRRLRDPVDVGVEVLMRYTLRLLTTQQFSRAAALICSLDQLRGKHPDLGGPFRIGVWLGGGTTPNRIEDAKAAFRKLSKGDRKAENPFLLLRCPWCAAQLGPIDGAAKKGPKVAGYAESGNRIIFQCPDRYCPYNSNTGLPLSVVDEEIYKSPPDFLLGTVDKFATLTWRPEARALFGIGPDGTREKSPPGLIIQDELHLISGPLGSVVGLYETAIEALCIDDREDPPVKPKIITSTATIRRFEEQACALYARSSVKLFPPHGIDAGDSFFAQYAKRDGVLLPGRLYVGIHAPGLGSIQTAQVRTFAALLQAPVALPDEQKDPWWTMLGFFNSLRELGTSLSLLQSDIPDYLNVMRSRYGLDWEEVRSLRAGRVKELTSRLRHDEIPQAIEDLQQGFGTGEALDVCIASNIIEVGVDIDRLSVMTVVGQPKSTSQYIQVTGRVGRRWKERPGLVATIYGASKPRDRSHFEHFRSYHERLYAQVEPTSATPFSPPVLDRALHAVLVALVRQRGPGDLPSWPFDDELEEQANRAIDLLQERMKLVDPDEADELERVLKYRIRQWRAWERTQWQARGTSAEQIPLLRRAGQWVPEEARVLSWATPNSMRDVDAECRIEITSAYRRAAGEEAGAQ